MARRYNLSEINLEINHVGVFKNESEAGLWFDWSSEIGFGEYNIYRDLKTHEWKGESEYMDSNEDKAFLKELMNKFIDKINIVN